VLGRSVWRRTLAESEEEADESSDDADESDESDASSRLRAGWDQLSGPYSRFTRWLDPEETLAFVLAERRRVEVERLAAHLAYSFADIATTGKLMGAVYALSGVIPPPARLTQEVSWEAVDRANGHFRATLEDKEQRLRGADRDNLARYQEENRLLSAPSASEHRVVFFGDSITDGWKLNQYFPGKPYVNRGISGQITGEMLGRMQADVIALKPEAMVILAGTNDLARGVPVPTIQNNLTMIGSLAEQAGITPVFASILPVSDHHKDVNPNYERTPGRPPEKIRELNAWLAAMCKARGFRYLDYFSAMVDENGQLRADLAEDGLHPNAEGYKIMAPLAQAAIEVDRKAAPEEGRRKRFGIF